MSLAWLNLVSLHVSAFLFVYLYILSAMPVTRAQKRGEKAWKECKWLRILAGFFESVMIADMILWIWFPVPNLAWSFHPDPLVGRIVAFAIAVPCSAILMKGIKDAGQETMRPSKSTKMFGEYTSTYGTRRPWVKCHCSLHSRCSSTRFSSPSGRRFSSVWVRQFSSIMKRRTC